MDLESKNILSGQLFAKMFLNLNLFLPSLQIHYFYPLLLKNLKDYLLIPLTHTLDNTSLFIFLFLISVIFFS